MAECPQCVGSGKFGGQVVWCEHGWADEIEPAIETIIIPGPAFTTLGETRTMLAPVAWHERIAAIGSRCEYGPTYSRTIVEHLQDMTREVSRGNIGRGHEHLMIAEGYAAR